MDVVDYFRTLVWLVGLVWFGLDSGQGGSVGWLVGWLVIGWLVVQHSGGICLGRE